VAGQEELAGHGRSAVTGQEELAAQCRCRPEPPAPAEHRATCHDRCPVRRRVAEEFCCRYRKASVNRCYLHYRSDRQGHEHLRVAEHLVGVEGQVSPARLIADLF
jgi:hypothetical protein